jgi:hypothetical protein
MGLDFTAPNPPEKVTFGSDGKIIKFRRPKESTLQDSLDYTEKEPIQDRDNEVAQAH